jgi:hypothetical protein
MQDSKSITISCSQVCFSFLVLFFFFFSLFRHDCCSEFAAFGSSEKVEASTARRRQKMKKKNLFRRILRQFSLMSCCPSIVPLFLPETRLRDLEQSRFPSSPSFFQPDPAPAPNQIQPTQQHHHLVSSSSHHSHLYDEPFLVHS